MVFIRRHFFAKKFQHIIEAAAAKKAAGLIFQPPENNTKSYLERLMAFITGKPIVAVDAGAVDEENIKKERGRSKFSPNMIRRIDEPPKPINPSGNLSERQHPSLHRTTSLDSERAFTPTTKSFEEFPSNNPQARRCDVSLDINSKMYVTRLFAVM